MDRFLDISVSSEPVRDPGVFYLTDPCDNASMAYSFCSLDRVDALPLAEVRAVMSLRFVPIDHNPEFDRLEQSRNRRCDGLIRSEDAAVLVFVELKNRDVKNLTSTKTWIKKAIDQLRQTIVLFRREEAEKSKLMFGGCHRAYVCNPKGPYQVPESVRSAKKVFMMATKGFVLYCNNKIVIESL